MKRFHVEHYAVVAVELDAETEEAAIEAAKEKIENVQEDLLAWGVWVQPVTVLGDGHTPADPFAEEIEA